MKESVVPFNIDHFSEHFRNEFMHIFETSKDDKGRDNTDLKVFVDRKYIFLFSSSSLLFFVSLLISKSLMSFFFENDHVAICAIGYPIIFSHYCIGKLFALLLCCYYATLPLVMPNSNHVYLIIN